MITKIHSSSSKIASVLDPFSFASFANEAHLVQVRPDHITAQLSSINPDFLFVESAWHGVDDLWFGKICEPSPELLELISLCKERSIPTVFWCKEDPIHFDRFLLTASLFDYVFTTDINCIPLYKQALAHSRVGLLPFACQPLAHNPVENFPRKDAISYAGSFYRRFPDRVTDTDNILGIASQIRSLDIFDRYFDSEDENYRFPERYEQFIRGSLPPDQVDLSYKGYRYGINLNTVKNSESMFARRAIELLASGTMIISNSIISSTATGMTMVVNEEDFFHYTNFRILDSIGYPGAYRKFLLRRKDQGSEWAIKMNNHVVVVQHSIRELSILEQVSLSVAHAACGMHDWGGG